MNRKFIDAIWLKSTDSRTAATIMTQIAFRFGFRACSQKQSKKTYPEPIAYKDQTWEAGSGWNPTFKYIKKRLDKLTAKTRPSKKALIAMLDLRTSKVNLCYECTLKTEKSKTWIVCDPFEIITDSDELK